MGWVLGFHEWSIAAGQPTRRAPAGHATPHGVNDATRGGQGSTAGGALVARNALCLVVGQVVTAALSFVVAALLARHLGAEHYGVFFLAAVFVETAFTFVEFGQEYYIVRELARHRRGLGHLLGTAVAFRAVVAVAIAPAVLAAARMFGYADTTRTAISLMLAFFLLGSLANGFSIVFRGVERMDYEAAARVAFKALVAVAASPPRRPPPLRRPSVVAILARPRPGE